MLFREEANRQITSNVESSLIIAISQSGETEAIINDVREAESKGFSAICFTRRSDSKLARMSDLTFLVDASNQTLISAVPNQFFGKVILAFEELMGRLFASFRCAGTALRIRRSIPGTEGPLLRDCHVASLLAMTNLWPFPCAQ